MPPVERQAVLRQGEGGDDTTAIDAAAERAILARLEGIDDLTIVSEEIGIVGGGATRVVVDPIDSRSSEANLFISVRSRTGRRWATSTSDTSTTSARVSGCAAQEGALLDGRREIAPGRIWILSFRGDSHLMVAGTGRKAMVGLAYRLRIMGSLALSLCHLAAGRVDAVCSLKPARSVDIAAGSCSCANAGSRSTCSRIRRSSRAARPRRAFTRRRSGNSRDVHEAGGRSKRVRIGCARGARALPRAPL